MRVIDSLILALMLAACGSTPVDSPAGSSVADPLADPDALERAATETRTLDDPDAPPTSTPLDIRDATLRTRDGTPLSLPTAREQSRRARLSAELGDLRTIADDQLEQLRLHWYTRGAGIVLQNTSEHALALSVHFRASTDPACGETVYRGDVPPHTSTAPFAAAAAERGCDYDSAAVTLYDRFGLVVARAKVTP